MDDNKCLACHIPRNAGKFAATPIPQTHFTSYRPLLKEEDGKILVDAESNEVVERELGHFNYAMFICSQCHVAQANVTLEVPNMFNASFRQSAEKERSNLKEVMGEGVR